MHIPRYSLQTAEQMVFGASLQLCKMKDRFYNINLVTPKIWIFHSFSYAVQLLLRKKTVYAAERQGKI